MLLLQRKVAGCHIQPTGRLRQGKSRRSAFRPSLCALSRPPPLLNHIFNRHPTKSIVNHAAPPPPFGVQCSALRQTRDCVCSVACACQWSSRTSFYSLDHVCSTGHDTHTQMFYCNFGSRLSNPTYCLLRYCCCCSFISTSKSTTPCCHVFNAALKKSHTVRVRVRVARKR